MRTVNRRVHKISAATGEVQDTLDLTPSLLDRISHFNTYLSPRAVEMALREGQAVHTEFSRYELEA